MVGAFLYLTACSFKNRLRRRLQRLREPRYVVGLVVGLVYIYLAFLRRSGRSGTAEGVSAVAAFSGPLQVFGSLFLFAIAASAWALPGVGQPPAYSRAEVQFLFPAPVTRRQLLHFKLLQSQVAILVGSAIVALLLRPGSSAAGWTFLVGLWVLLMTLRLHLMGVALRRGSLAAHGASGLARQWLPLAVVIGAVAVLAATAVRAWPVLSASGSGSDTFAELQRLTGQGAAGAVLWPFTALVRLPLSGSAADFLAALPAALGILALNYSWVLRSDARFEEASAEQAEKRAAARTAPRSGIRGAAPTPFRLAPEGPPEIAILWKNLILVGRYLSLRTLLRLLPLLVVCAVLARGQGGGVSEFAARMSLPLAAMAVLLGPQVMRNDLRQDLARIDLLKTWPVRGAALIRGEVLAPTVVVTAAAWLLLLVAALFGGGLRPGSGEAAAFGVHRGTSLIAAAILVPAVVLSQTVVQNGLAVLFPAWVAVGTSRARGIDAIGQRMLMLAAVLLTLLVSLVPGALVAAVVAGAVYWLTGTTLILLPALIAAALVVGECSLAIEGLGRVLERTDPGVVESGE